MDARGKAVERARALEKAGKLDAAVQAFREAGAADDAARILAGQRKPKEAGKVLVDSLGVHPSQAGQLDAAGKKRALMAAIHLGKAGELPQAVELFVALGERQRAADLLRRAGDDVGAARVESGQEIGAASIVVAQARGSASIGAPADGMGERLEASGKLEPALSTYVGSRRFGDAARVAKKLGRVGEAANFHLEAGEPFEAAELFIGMGDRKSALDAIVRVPRDDGRYRAAAVRAVGLATALNDLPFELEHFLGRFLGSGVKDADEAAAFSAMAAIYERRKLPGEAAELLKKVLARDPSDAQAAKRLAAIEAGQRPSALQVERLVADADLHYRGTPGAQVVQPLPDLEPLPDVEMPTRMGMPTVRSIPPVAPPERKTERFHGPGGSKTHKPQTNPPAAVEEHGEIGPNSVIANRYRIEDELGRGGMAVVYRAHDLELDEDVALKVFPGPGTPELLARFKQELKLSRQVVHENVVRLYDIGAHAGRRYLSMELLVGDTLKHRLRHPYEFHQAIDWLVQACHGLQAAHDKGVIHRDVKPDNFFLTSKGTLKVMDFGIAKAQAAPGLTTGNAVAGTPAYMSPEQINAFSQVSHATDVYALGCCAYEVFTGTVPFSHPEVVPLLLLHLQQTPEAPQLKNPTLPDELDRLILSMLAKDPKDRPQSCREVAAALTKIASA